MAVGVICGGWGGGVGGGRVSLFLSFVFVEGEREGKGEEDEEILMRLLIARLTIFDFAIVTISDRVTIARNVTLMTAGERLNGFQYARPIVIEEDCEIGANVLVLPGIRIGKRCKVDQGTIVAKDIPDGSVVTGKPARVVGSIKGDGEVEYCN